MTKSTALFSANSNTELAASTADYLGIPLGQCSVNKFADGEVSPSSVAVDLWSRLDCIERMKFQR